jgi:hypothetical protein
VGSSISCWAGAPAILDDTASAFEGCNRILALRTLSQRDGVVFERDAGVRLVVRAIERVYAGTIATHRNDRRAVSIEHDGCFSVALPRAGCDRLAGCFDCKRSWNAMRRQRIRGTHRCANGCTTSVIANLDPKFMMILPATPRDC